MKTLGKYLMLLTAFCALSVTSCVNDDLAERQDLGAGKIAALEDQAAAIEASVADIEALQTALGEERDAGLEKSASALEDHVADLRAKAPFMDATMTTLALQKKLAEAVGAVLASDSNGDLAKHAAALEKGVKTWLGKHLTAYYPTALAQARTASAIASLDLKIRKLNIEAILSDVEAGLSAYEDVEGLSALAEKVNGNCETAASLAAELSALTEEVEAEYTKAVETVVSNPENFDAPAIKQFNAGVQTKADEADNTLAGLIYRVEACEAQLADIKTRLEALKSKVDDLEKLLGMIQSVTFMSEYSEEKAIAYYTLGSESRADGKKVRNPQGTIDLRYVIRPASAAQALTASDLWDNEVKVFGYYANTITKAAPETFNFDITNVTADDNGIVTVTVSAKSLNESFYFKETGAKLALSITTGKTDLTSKFVEIVPKDASGTVYLETLTLSKDEVEIDEGDELNLSAILSPNNVTNTELLWTTDEKTIVFVSGEGRITGTGVGETHVRVTSKGTDEWGNTLSASCRVKVNPAIKLSGPSYVEQGKTADLTLDYPASMLVESKVWYTSDENKVTASNEGVITGVDHTYNENTYEYSAVTVYCKINDAILLSHDVKVVVPQPRQVKFNDYADDVSEITMKLDQTVSLAGTVLPAEASSNFRLFYESNAGTLGWIDSSSGLIKGSSFAGDVTVYARVFEIDKHHRFAPGKSLTRAVTVKAEPYWVESVTLPATLTLAPDATATLTPTFTSDVSGKQPTNTSLTWSSSNPSIVSINSTTGEMTAHGEGTVIITATTSHANAVPSGQPQKYATCAVTVKKPTAPITIGDYYYSDGTWGSDANPSGKSVIGVIFSTANAVASDNQLRNDYPKCFNGLVVSTVEYTSVAAAGRGWSYVDAGSWCKNNGYSSYNDQSNPCGYTNTKGYIALNGSNTNSWGHVIDFTLFNSSSPIITHRNNVAVPETASAWYVPSYKEMQLLYENREAVNNSINAVSGNPLHIAHQYWISTFDLDNKIIRAFNMTDGTWCSSSTTDGTSLPVRVILAF